MRIMTTAITVGIPAPAKICSRLGCRKPITGKRRRYCSDACSAATRNRRYYLTLRGRINKQTAASRYFQNHREELYAKRRARMDRYVEQIILNGKVDASEGRLNSNRRGLSDHEYTLLAARNLARVQHDWHGGPYDGPMGRFVYKFDLHGRLLNPPPTFERDGSRENGVAQPPSAIDSMA